MGFFDLFKRNKKETKLESLMAAQMKRMFPKGIQELNEQV